MLLVLTCLLTADGLLKDYNMLGFMQGRLSPIVNGKIQAFPWEHWEEEMELANRSGFGLMEWTLDQERLHENPLMFHEGRRRIKELCAKNNLKIESLTGDCFIQQPFWIAEGGKKEKLQMQFRMIVNACSLLGIKYIVVPLVDHGRIETSAYEFELKKFLAEQLSYIRQKSIKILFEIDLIPVEVKRFIDELPADQFGINYDMGNSAALGFEPEEEFQQYGSRILNVHIKDRILGGSTVPLGSGSTDFNLVFSQLKNLDYRGHFILQTARSSSEDHLSDLCKYREFVRPYCNF